VKVLVAEDDAVSRRLLQRFLENWGHEVVLTANGAEAWERFQAEAPPLVITDWMMPEMDGLELIRRIRSSPDAAYPYVLLVTTRTETGDLVEGMEAGADDFVAKPLDRDELRARLRAGERIAELERSLLARNRELDSARVSLERRVEERTAELKQANAALRAEIKERERTSAGLRAAQERLVEAESEKKRFYREVIRAVTQDKLHLVDPEEIPTDGRPVAELSLDEPSEYSALRNRLRDLQEQAGLSMETAEEFVLAAGEAATNSIKHATGVRAAIYVGEGRIAVRVSDEGQGIRTEDLPASVLTAGYSTKVSLGMGYTLMLSLVDRIWLATGPHGTVVQLEKRTIPAEPEEELLLAAWDRF